MREEGCTSCVCFFSFIIYMQMEHRRVENRLIYPNLASIDSLCIKLHTKKRKEEKKKKNLRQHQNKVRHSLGSDSFRTHLVNM